MNKPFSRIVVLAALLAVLCSAPLQAQLLSKKTVSLELAKKVAAAAEAEALKNNWTMVIVIVDEGANLVYLEKIDGTQLGSSDVALDKAKTALRFKRPTKVFEDMVLKDGRMVILALPEGTMPIEGGLPLIVDGVPIGAIGVSGGKSTEDGVVAKAAVDAFTALVQAPANK